MLKIHSGSFPFIFCLDLFFSSQLEHLSRFSCPAFWAFPQSRTFSLFQFPPPQTETQKPLIRSRLGQRNPVARRGCARYSLTPRVMTWSFATLASSRKDFAVRQWFDTGEKVDLAGRFEPNRAFRQWYHAFYFHVSSLEGASNQRRKSKQIRLSVLWWNTFLFGWILQTILRCAFGKGEKRTTPKRLGKGKPTHTGEGFVQIGQLFLILTSFFSKVIFSKREIWFPRYKKNAHHPPHVRRKRTWSKAIFGGSACVLPPVG